MEIATAAKLTPPVRKFRFNSGHSIGDLLIVVNKLEKEGKPPFLKFVGYSGEIDAIDVVYEDHAGPPAEMGVVGQEDALPDPAVEPPSMRQQVLSVVNGNRAKGGLPPLELYVPGPRD